jgi:uncharacterized membrane protein
VCGIFLAIIAAAMLHAAVRRVRSAREFERVAPFLLLLFVATPLGLLLGPSSDDGATFAEALAALLVSAGVVGAAALATRPLTRHPALVVAICGLVGAAGFLSTSAPSAAVAVGFSAAASMFAVARWRLPAQFLPWAFIAVGCLTIASTEFVYVVDDLQGGQWQRMNTVFKFYLQAWLLLGIGAAVLLARMLAQLRLPALGAPNLRLGFVARRFPHADADVFAGLSWRGVTRFVLVLTGLSALVLGLAYPALGTPVRLDQDMPSSPQGLTLDGYAWMETGSITNATGEVITFSGDLDAINWLNAHADKTSVIVEAGIGPYRGNGARISSGAGMPAVIGWDRHQYQQRYPEGIAKRMADVRAIYNSTDPTQKLELLRRYDARYVVVGDVERYWNTSVDDPAFYASEAGLRVFDAMVGQSLRLAFVSGATRIYEVIDFPALRPAADAIRAL